MVPLAATITVAIDAIDANASVTTASTIATTTATMLAPAAAVAVEPLTNLTIVYHLDLICCATTTAATYAYDTMNNPTSFMTLLTKF